MMSGMRLPKNFRKLSLDERRRVLRRTLAPEEEQWQAISCGGGLLELSDLMVESAVGCLPVPLGLAAGFLVDGEELAIPMAVEEPSVIAAASYAAFLLRPGGGLSTMATEPLMTAQVFLEGVPPGGEGAIRKALPQIEERLGSLQRSLAARGGGFRGLEVRRLPECGVTVVGLRMDVRDAMGANLLNTAAEAVRELLERASGGSTLMAILSNAARERRAAARFTLPLEALRPADAAGLGPAEIARRIVLAAEVAGEDPDRAVTHNKGVMNGISALALATGNDTRAVEAAAHAWACRKGTCRPLSAYALRSGALEGSLELPLPFATVGGAAGFHPASRLALNVLGNPNGRRLARIAAALGLAQNFAALLALVTTGIQKGHMRYHAARTAYMAGARGAEIRRLADLLAARGCFGIEEARSLLARLREGQG